MGNLKRLSVFKELVLGGIVDVQNRNHSRIYARTNLVICVTWLKCLFAEILDEWLDDIAASLRNRQDRGHSAISTKIDVVRDDGMTTEHVPWSSDRSFR